MTEALLVSNLVLWVVVVALSALVLALLRQVGILHERIAPAGALATATTLEVGNRAPSVAATDWSGAVRTVGAPDPEGVSTLLLFVSPTCPVCKTLLPIAQTTVAAESRQRTTRLVLASDGPRSEHEAFVRDQQLNRYGYVLSASLGLAYGVAKLPWAVLIDADGVVRARGLVNTREHLESLFEARERGVGTIQDYVAARNVA
jgi:methylamine dehydrogenase accessory protein MauD